MKNQFDILNANRELISKLIEKYTFEQLNTIPEGFKNNIVWNIGHLNAIQQSLTYKLSGLTPVMDSDLIENYTKGTFPSNDVEISKARFEKIKELFLSLPKKTEEDYHNDAFKGFKEYKPSTVNVTLESIEDVIAFNNFHEGLHLGTILALTKLI